MIFKEITCKRNRLDGADAVKLVQTAMRFDSEITIEIGAHKYNAKSLMSVISTGLDTGDAVVVLATGDDEKAAIEAIEEFLIRNS